LVLVLLGVVAFQDSRRTAPSGAGNGKEMAKNRAITLQRERATWV
jgi:hypothetical protein